MSAKHLRQSAVEWILSPELPDDETAVLVARADGDVHEAYHGDGDWWYANGPRMTERVIAWAHMPEVPAAFLNRVKPAPKPLRRRVVNGIKIAAAVYVRQTGGIYHARIGKGEYARAASSTSSAYAAALAAAAKFFRPPASHIALAFVGDELGQIQFRAERLAKPVKTIVIEFEDQGQDFLEWEIIRENGQIVNCTPFQYTTWAKCRVVDPDGLKIGARPIIRFPSGDFMRLKYPIAKIRKEGGAS